MSIPTDRGEPAPPGLHTEPPRLPGRPRKWPSLLELVRRGGVGSFGPYKTHESAVANASYFNAQLRKVSPPDYAAFRFRGVGNRVECKPYSQVDVSRTRGS